MNHKELLEYINETWGNGVSLRKAIQMFTVTRQVSDPVYGYIIERANFL